MRQSVSGRSTAVSGFQGQRCSSARKLLWRAHHNKVGAVALRQPALHSHLVANGRIGHVAVIGVGAVAENPVDPFVPAGQPPAVGSNICMNIAPMAGQSIDHWSLSSQEVYASPVRIRGSIGYAPRRHLAQPCSASRSCVTNAVSTPPPDTQAAWPRGGRVPRCRGSSRTQLTTRRAA